MSKQKSLIRQERKLSRLALNFSDRQFKSKLIEERLISIVDWARIKRLHVFEPLLTLGEVDISDFTSYIKANYPEIKIYTTRQLESIWQLTLLSLDDSSTSPIFDVVIVPMISFDMKLQRIGYGGGYYDMFLMTQPQTYKIGVCFEEGRIEKVPAEKHDIPMDVIVTETTIYKPI